LNFDFSFFVNILMLPDIDYARHLKWMVFYKDSIMMNIG